MPRKLKETKEEEVKKNRPKCEFCGKTFYDKSNLNRHIKDNEKCAQIQNKKISENIEKPNIDMISVILSNTDINQEEKLKLLVTLFSNKKSNELEEQENIKEFNIKLINKFLDREKFKKENTINMDIGRLIVKFINKYNNIRVISKIQYIYSYFENGKWNRDVRGLHILKIFIGEINKRIVQHETFIFDNFGKIKVDEESDDEEEPVERDENGYSLCQYITRGKKCGKICHGNEIYCKSLHYSQKKIEDIKIKRTNKSQYMIDSNIWELEELLGKLYTNKYQLSLLKYINGNINEK